MPGPAPRLFLEPRRIWPPPWIRETEPQPEQRGRGESAVQSESAGDRVALPLDPGPQ